MYLGMAKTQFGICALTGERCKLQESHIYPKFVYKHLKQTGGGRFRDHRGTVPL